MLPFAPPFVYQNGYGPCKDSDLSGIVCQSCHNGYELDENTSSCVAALVAHEYDPEDIANSDLCEFNENIGGTSTCVVPISTLYLSEGKFIEKPIFSPNEDSTFGQNQIYPSSKGVRELQIGCAVNIGKNEPCPFCTNLEEAPNSVGRCQPNARIEPGPNPPNQNLLISDIDHLNALPHALQVQDGRLEQCEGDYMPVQLARPRAEIESDPFALNFFLTHQNRSLAEGMLIANESTGPFACAPPNDEGVEILQRNLLPRYWD